MGHHAEILRSLLLLPSDTLPLILQGWTLVYEMFFYVVFAALLAFVAERFLILALLGWAAATCGLAYWLAAGHVSGATLRLIGDPLVLEFIAGCICALIWPVVNKPWSFVLLAGGIVALGASVSVGGHVGLPTIVQWRSLYFGVPAVLVVLGTVSLEYRAKLVAPRALRTLGDASYSLYLSHVLVISAIGRVYSRLALATFGPWLGTLLCIVVAIVVGYLSFRLVESPLNDLCKRALRRAARFSAA